MAKSKKNEQAKKDPLLPLKIYQYFNEYVGSKERTLDEILLERNKVPGNDEFTLDQLRTAINHLVDDGYLECRKDSSQNNKGYYRLPSMLGSNEIDEQAMFEYVTDQLIGGLIVSLDGLDTSAFIHVADTSMNNQVGLFVTVPPEEFYTFDFKDFEMVSQLYELYKEQFYATLTFNDSTEQKKVFVLQVRLWKDGFVLICLKPTEQSPALRYYKLKNLESIDHDKALNVNNMLQLQDLEKDIASLSNDQIKYIAKNT